MIPALDLDQLRTLSAIDEYGGFGRAADALALSQSTVSQHVRSLEKALRLTIVRKEGRRSVFTPAGRELLLEARRILSVHDEAMAHLLRGVQRTATIGVDEVIAAETLGDLVHAVGHRHPDLTVRVRVDGSAPLSDAVATGALDLAVTADAGHSHPGRTIGQVPLRWYAASIGEPIPGDGSPMRVIVSPDPRDAGHRAIRLLAEHGYRTRTAAEATSPGAVVDAVRAGLGIAALPVSGGDRAGLREVPTLPDPGSLTIRLAGREGVDWRLAETVTGLIRDLLCAPASADA